MNYLYTFVLGILAIVAMFTGEIVTYVFLGMILLTLHNILNVLKEISSKLDRSRTEREELAD